MKLTALLKQDLTKTDPPPLTLLKKVQTRLEEFSETPYLDGLVLLSWASGLSKSRLLADPGLNLRPEQKATLENALLQVQNGIPLPYVLGEWDFYQLTFKVSPDVLIPRPETEGLVERALDWLKKNPGRRDCLEIGTGSGCIAIALANNLPDLRITASDISENALELARRNACFYEVEDQILFHKSDLLEGIEDNFDLVIANLPYIPTEKLLNLKVFQSEPRLALDGGPDGLSLITTSLEGVRALLKPRAVLLLELDEDHGQKACEIALNFFPRAEIQVEQDLSGLDRYLIIQT